MAVGSAAITVTTSATLLASAPNAGGAIGPVASVVLLPDPAVDVYLGPAGVTVTNGVILLHSTTLFGPLNLYPGDALYACTSASTATIKVLMT